MFLPSSFKLAGFTYTVDLADDDYLKMRSGGDEVLGLFIQYEQRILLARPRETISEATVEQTFCHEAVHALLSTAGYPELSADEKLVDLLGNFLHQLIKTLEFERPVPSSG